MFSANTSQVSADQVYVEDVFSTYLYTGTPAYAQTIVNGIDLAGKGGLLWIKSRTSDTAPDHYLNFNDGSNIVSNQSNNTSARQVMSPYVAFNSNGFYVNAAPGFLNNNGVNYTSWTFRKAPKFFDVVTYTGDGTGDRTISHSLTTSPGMVIIRPTNLSTNWRVWHRYDSTKGLRLNLTDAQSTNDFLPSVSSTGITVDTTFNGSGNTYVAYLFAHDTTSDGIIQCGSYTGNGSSFGPTVSLGWEPQWLLIKRASAAEDWVIYDNMRGVAVDGIDAELAANSSSAEFSGQNRVDFTATGFVPRQGYTTTNASGDTYIYIAIRRGPMRTPTSGTSVFQATASSAAVGTKITNVFPVDLHLAAYRPGDSYNFNFTDRLRGMMETNSLPAQKIIISSSSGAEQAGSTSVGYEFWNTSWRIGGYYNTASTIYYDFRRAPSFFDEVCYTGTGSLLNVNHNLGVAPELMLIKSRSAAEGWVVYSAPTGNAQIMNLNATTAAYSAATWNNTTPSATTFTLNGGGYFGNISGVTYVAYLFASAPGVSKVGSYTGNGSSQTINCGFAAGARFVMIKRTDSTGDWYVWDSARGIVAGNDPRLSLNSTAAEVTTDDSVDTDSSGFVVNQLSATNINVSSATYIYLAVA